MSEKDFAPLSVACIKALHDKLYDKRKAAALEIEKMVKEFAAAKNTVQIRKILKVLGQDLASSQNPHARKGGLIGLAATALGLGKDTAFYTEELIFPIVACFNDSDARIRFYACESLYNVVKVARGDVLPHFPKLFDALSKIATDVDQNVKGASELLDRLLKNIVAEGSSFDLDGFVPLLRERLFTRNSFARQFVISWISVLDTVPDIDLIVYLPELLDGLFRILDDTMAEVKKMCETVLGEFLRKIESDSSKVDFGAMINILINHAQDRNDEVVQFTAINWIKEFVQLSGPTMLPHMSGIFIAVLPCLAYDTDSRKNIKEMATAVNHNLMKLVALTVEEENESIRPLSEGAQKGKAEIDLPSVVDVLIQQLMHNSVQTKVAVLRWIHHLYIKLPNKMISYIDILFPALQRTLSDPADEVVQQCLVVISEIISPSIQSADEIGNTGRNVSQPVSEYYYKFVISLLNSFNTDKRLLEERGSFIIRQLCVLLNAEDIYRTLAEILLKEPNLKFASLMVETLNMILLTSSELLELRNKLKELKTDEACTFFCCLYETWCHNPIATVALCLLTQSYEHVCDLIRVFGSLEVTVEFLTEIDKLVQLIESPIFAYLRLDMLEVPCDQHLIRTLYGLLMLLPQTEAFHTLKNRLACIPSLHLHCGQERAASPEAKTRREVKNIDFAKLLKHFKEVQKKHQEYKKTNKVKELLLSEKDFLYSS